MKGIQAPVFRKLVLAASAPGCFGICTHVSQNNPMGMQKVDMNMYRVNCCEGDGIM